MDHSTAVKIAKDENGISQVLLRSPGGASVLGVHGGQVRSWKMEKGEDLLYSSKLGNRSSLEQHVFARNKMWAVDENSSPLQFDCSSKAFIDLLRRSCDGDPKHWPHFSYELRLRVILNVDGSLTLASRVRNVDCKPFSFSFAYHTYISVSDISNVRVERLETLDYLDNLCNRERFTEQGDSLTFESEFVWNPWEKRSKAIADLGDEEYKNMLCVDAAAIEKAITLKPGEEWTGRVQLSVMASIQ
ncbi:hypothetical protein OROHE_024668 [Orobanche hederae]